MEREKISNEMWTAARARWEGEPRCSYADLADFLGIARQNVGKRAIRERWQKKSNMPDIVLKAHAAADRNISGEAEKAAAPSKDDSQGDGQGKLSGWVDPAPSTSHCVAPALKGLSRSMLAQAVEDVAVDARAQILTRHRQEWPAVRSELYKALKNRDSEGLRLAKGAAETLKLMQDGERKAWGIDAGGDDKPTRIVIERTEGVRVVR